MEMVQLLVAGRQVAELPAMLGHHGVELRCGSAATAHAPYADVVLAAASVLAIESNATETQR